MGGTIIREAGGIPVRDRVRQVPPVEKLRRGEVSTPVRKLTPEEKSVERARIGDPERWPLYPLLCLKRQDPTTGKYQFGVIRHETLKSAVLEVCTPPDARGIGLLFAEYGSIEEMVDDGWMGD